MWWGGLVFVCLRILKEKCRAILRKDIGFGVLVTDCVADHFLFLSFYWYPIQPNRSARRFALAIGLADAAAVAYEIAHSK